MEARAKFRQFRWGGSGGRPTCPKCNCDAVDHYKSRDIYKCRKCFRQFSDTSGTPWAYRKISFSDLMWLVASVAHTKQTRSAQDLAEDLGVAYKTVLLWVHKMRAEVARFAASLSLKGEVEIDGAYDGGSVRPKNMKKTRRDLRKIPYRANDRAHSVVAARQRGGGPIRTWVAKEESHARPFLMAAIEPGSTLFTDKAAGWKPARGKYRLFQIDHSTAYYTPEACTNQVETLWAQMRVNGRVHRSISRNYLDLYAAEVAWTLGKGKKAAGVAFGELMEWMSRSGRSPLAGYFQGQKRFLPVCKPNHTIEGWKPSNKRARIDFIRNGKEPIEYKPRRPLAKTCREGFTFVSAEAFLADPTLVPDGPGVYAVFLRGGREVLQASGYIEHRDQPLWTHEGADHAYTGETYGIRTRLREHLKGDVYTSSFRETLMALQIEVSLSHPWEGVAEQQAGMERGLTDWLRNTAVIGWKSCGYVKDVEDAILDTSASPLNIVRHQPTGYTRLLQALRRRFRAEIMDHWTKASTLRRPVRR